MIRRSLDDDLRRFKPISDQVRSSYRHHSVVQDVPVVCRHQRAPALIVSSRRQDDAADPEPHPQGHDPI